MMNYKTRTTGAPPAPPLRHSSMRGSAPVTPPTGVTTAPSFGNSNNANAVSRLVIDLETKFGKRFHNVTEFPKPPPFVNIQKVYPSRTVKATNVTTATSINNNNNNNNNVTTDNNNLNTNSTTTISAAAPTITTPKPLQPAGYIPFKKHRAPAPPPPQVGLAAATAAVIRQSSFLYGSAGFGTQHTQ